MTASRNVLVVDLDGTLVLDNSFHVFLSYAWQHATLRARLQITLVIMKRLVGRLCGFDQVKSRVLMKKRMLSVVDQWSIDDQHRLANSVVAKLADSESPCVVELLSAERQAGSVLLLATAAPAMYAELVARKYGFDHVLATPRPHVNGWAEMFGEEKKRAVLEWVDQFASGSRIKFVTDHEDDLPLMQAASEVILQAPPATLDRLPPGLVTQHWNPAESDSRGGMWLWFAGRLVGPIDAWEAKTIMSKHRYALYHDRDGTWRRAWGVDLNKRGGLRSIPPSSPAVHVRLRVAARRRVERDMLKIFH